ncbi:hypothetical protein HO173_003007 [Letharia columbiana]|uniref:Uncharacterized protein n=1 Tax=Letharia columbiana TaxID=112416 RepID=A0A8H6G2D7_9LECA|nr:uncharacterized protein HO173_003007 [Letharia columbiana]KAF6239134.1 hypothetical protein HO173_003007 [Letharia columbiana]
MWKRLNNKDRQAEIAIESSTLTETTAEEDTLQGTPNINNGSFSISSRPAFGRKRTEDVLKALPALPLYVPILNQEASEADTESNKLQISGVTNGRPLSEAPTASSVYSQPSPELNSDSTRKNGHKIRSSSLYPDDVSPPGSPHMNDGYNGPSRRSSPDVSPVSESPSPLADRSPVFTSGRFNSNIPVAKKTRKFWNRPSTNSPEQGSSLTHWDVYSGEPTTREKGKPPQTTPSAVKLNAEPSPGRLNGNLESFGTSTHISSGSTIGRKRVASRDLNNAPIVRPEWRGAGGRHKIVNPLLDKPLPPGKSPTFPAGSEKHQKDQRDQDRTIESSTPSHSPQELTTRPTRPSITLNDKALGQRVTSPDAKTESSPDSVIPPTFRQNTQSPNSSLSTDDARSPLARNPSNEEIKDHRLQMLPDVPQTIAKDVHSPHLQQMQEMRSQTIPEAVLNNRDTERDPSRIESRFRADLQHLHLQDQPPSRFSSTTYATTTYDSPPTTPELSSNSPSMSAISTTPNSILNRKRPVPPAGISNSKVTARKPTPSELGTPKQVPEGKRKSLPKSPPEVEATSRIASLQAKLDNLHQRRKNLQTVIHELTNVVQPSSIAYDMASRQEIKRTVDALGKELAEVGKDEHETGLMLHRALKRDDEFAAYEPTSIWVRRVTS